jgi:hypothetical protein
MMRAAALSGAPGEQVPTFLAMSCSTFISGLLSSLALQLTAASS